MHEQVLVLPRSVCVGDKDSACHSNNFAKTLNAIAIDEIPLIVEITWYICRLGQMVSLVKFLEDLCSN